MRRHLTHLPAPAAPLADIAARQAIPLDYLLVLMALFGILVLDRLAYTLGAPLFKALHALKRGRCSCEGA